MEVYLIHGGWQGGWCWQGVKSELESRGHRVSAPTLPGLEVDSVRRAAAGLSSLVAFVARDMVKRDLRDVVLVGHSGGGPVVQGVLEFAGERVATAVYMSARILLDGECILDHVEPDRRREMTSAAAASHDNSVTINEEVWVNGLCADINEAWARAYWPGVVPCPFGWLDQPARLPTDAWRRVPSAYIFLKGERPAAQSLYRKMAARLPNARIEHCPGGHQAMLSQPVEVAEAILRAGRETSL